MLRIGLLFAMVLSAGTALAQDDHSFARFDQARVRDVYLDLDVSFERKELAGFAEYRLDWQDGAPNHVIFDTRDLRIERAQYRDAEGQWHAARHRLAARHRAFGSKLTIELPSHAERVRVYYRTAPSASGLQWLTPEQTLDKAAPFLFSQSQAIHARSWVPIQDTPAVRFTYRARIGVPAGLRAVMSADGGEVKAGGGDFRFTMAQPIPSYLLAIAVGKLEFQAIGARSGVYAEPGRIAAAAKEFEDTEKMIEAAEQLYGPYRWGRYDILVLPPSFPFGGMENPRMTFATPTVIAGDKSLVALIAHELAHSWSGNLVTNAGWPHFWLNEGFTTYVENRIVESLYGAEVALMQQHIDQTELLEEVKDLPEGDRRMIPDMRGRDPDDAYSRVPYTRGAWLLRTLELRVGRAAFDAFLRGWFDHNAFKSVTTDDFLAYLDEHLLSAHPDAMPHAELEAWLHAAALPDSAKVTESARFAAVAAQRDAWLKGELAAGDLGKNWITEEWVQFLNTLPVDLPIERVRELDAAHHLTQSGNSEIAQRWYLAGIRANYAPVREPMRTYLLQIGRRKLVVPLYTELAKTPANLAWAREVYAQARPAYHPITQNTVDAVLKR
jgi:aminopeptidase N